MVNDIQNVLLSEEKLASIVHELGERISVLLSDGKLSATVMDKKEEAR